MFLYTQEHLQQNLGVEYVNILFGDQVDGIASLIYNNIAYLIYNDIFIYIYIYYLIISNQRPKLTLMNNIMCSNYPTSKSETDLNSPHNFYIFLSFHYLINHKHIR